MQDFGDHADQYYSVQTQEGEQIAALIAGYIDIIIRKVRFMVRDNFPESLLYLVPSGPIISIIHSIAYFCTLDLAIMQYRVGPKNWEQLGNHKHNIYISGLNKK